MRFIGEMDCLLCFKCLILSRNSQNTMKQMMSWRSSLHLDKYLLLVLEGQRDHLRKEDHVVTSISCSAKLTSVEAHAFLFLYQVVECLFLWPILISSVFQSCVNSCHVYS